MDEHIEHGDDSGVARSGFGRREMLQRTGFVVGAAALWATPVVQTVGMRPAAATEIADFCPDEDSAPPTRLIFRYTPAECNGWPPALERCSGSVVEGRVNIEVVGNQGPTNVSGFFCDVEPGDRLLIDEGGSLTPNLRFIITPADGGAGEQINQIHTSCSQPLNVNEQYGSFTLTYGEAPDRPAKGNNVWEKTLESSCS